MERKIEELHSRRLDAIGVVAAALPHEIDQPLNARAADRRVARRPLEKAEQEHARDTPAVGDKAPVQTERGLARRDEPDKTLLSMPELLRSARNAFLSGVRPAGFVVGRSCAAEKSRVLAEWTPFREAIDSSFGNIDEAMRANVSGQLPIATSCPDDKTIRR